MSRSGYVDDCENIELYRGAVERALRGRRGQQFLRELAAALDALPERVLIANELVDEAGDCCAIGAVCRARGVDTTGVDDTCPETVGRLVGIASSMAAEIEFMNDEWNTRETPAQRWARMRRWVDEQITPAPA